MSPRVKAGGPEPEPETDTVESETPDPKVTTAKTKDFRGVALINAIPGTTNAKDYLGRDVTEGDKDYLGRGLVA